MAYRTTMTGSWFRSAEIMGLLAKSPTGELSPEHESEYLAAEREAIREQLHPAGSAHGLDEVSNGQQRVSGYTTFLPNRFQGFSSTERAAVETSPELLREILDSNPAMAAVMENAQAAFRLPRIVDHLEYIGGTAAAREARDAARLAKEEGAPSVFLPSPSPGVVTIFYPRNPAVHPTHLDYLHELSRELAKEYRAILDVPGTVLQIDAPDLAMGKQIATGWGMDFYQALPHHVDAVNAAIAGLPPDRIRVHYCYGNYVASHASDAEFGRVLPELVRLRVKALVGELANPHHEGDLLTIRRYARDHGWPTHLGFVGGVIDVKTPIVESRETVKLRLDQLASIVGETNAWGGTDCGFETFAGMNGVTHSVALQKLRALAEGARLAS